MLPLSASQSVLQPTELMAVRVVNAVDNSSGASDKRALHDHKRLQNPAAGCCRGGCLNQRTGAVQKHHYLHALGYSAACYCIRHTAPGKATQLRPR